MQNLLVKKYILEKIILLKKTNINKSIFCKPGHIKKVRLKNHKNQAQMPMKPYVNPEKGPKNFWVPHQKIYVNQCHSSTFKKIKKVTDFLIKVEAKNINFFSPYIHFITCVTLSVLEKPFSSHLYYKASKYKTGFQ